MSDRATFRTDHNFIIYNTLAALTFLVYDILLVLPLEVEFVWKQRWSSGKVLYTWNRFFGVSTVVVNMIAYFEAPLPKKMTLFFPWWQGISICLAFITIEFILQARIFAVYEGNKKLLFIMAASFLVTLGLTWFLYMRYKGMEVDLHTKFLKWYPYLWVPPLVFETFLCLLMVFKATTLYRREVRSPLLIVLIRDSIMYFVIVLTTLLTNCVGSYLRPTAVGFGLSWVIAVPCALGSRILLNMRREYFGPRECFNESNVRVEPDLGEWHVAPVRSRA